MTSAPTLQAPPVHLCGRKLETTRHTCCFFSGRDEEYAVMAPFVQEGLEQGEQVIQIIGKDAAVDHDQRLSRAGARVTDAIRKGGQYGVVTSEDAYLAGGLFDVDRTLKTLDTLLTQRRDAGYPQLRVTGNMEWALSGGTPTEKLLEYESRVNQVSAKHHDPFVCFYDINQFDAPTLMDVMRSHPAVIIGGVFHENPFFVAPEKMLRELSSRPRRDVR